MPSKDIKKISLAKNAKTGTYTIIGMDGMVDVKVEGGLFRVDDELTEEQVGWLCDQWVTNNQDEDRNLTQYTLKIKRGH